MTERDQLLRKVEQLEKACAEMRLVLRGIIGDRQDVPELAGGSIAGEFDWYDCRAALHALSTSCGSSYIHRDEVRPLVEALELSTYLVSHCGVFQWKTGFKTEHSFAKCAKSIEQALTNSRRI